MKRVLVLCTGNTCRSVMGEAFMTGLVSHEGLAVLVESAGIQAFTDDGATEQTVDVMQEFGLDVSGHRAQRVNQDLVEKADLILTMTSEQRRLLLELFPESAEKTYTLTTYADLQEELGVDVVDPFGQTGDRYRQTASIIKQAMERIVAKWEGKQR